MEIKTSNDLTNDWEKKVIFGNEGRDYMLKKWVSVDEILQTLQKARNEDEGSISQT